MKDNIKSLINKNGFHDKNHGRCGIIYYVDQEKVCEIDYEISGVSEYDILINFHATNRWSVPYKTELLIDEKLVIKNQLIAWLKKKNIKADIDF